MSFPIGSLHLLLPNIEEVVIRLNTSYQVTYLSRPFAGLNCGQDIIEALGEALGLRLREQLELSAEGIRRFVLGHPGRSSSARVWLSLQVMKEADEDSAGYLLLATDLNSRRLQYATADENHEAICQQQKMHAIAGLANSIAHEISNPIQGIMNYAELIQATCKPASRCSEFAAEISRETERVSNTVRDLLDFARQDEPVANRVALPGVIAAVLSLQHGALTRDQIDVSVELAPDLPDIACRVRQIEQVLLSLVSNARDALNARFDGYHPDKRISISGVRFVESECEWLRISVRDFGIGVDEAWLECAFEPFWSTKDESHAGLGLTVGRFIAEHHEGRLSLSETTPGALAILELRLRDADKAWERRMLAHSSIGSAEQARPAGGIPRG